MTRISYKEIAPGAYRSMRGLERYVGESGLEHSVLELVRTRASQLNGCAFCLDMHSKDAIAAGETPQRLLVHVQTECAAVELRRTRPHEFQQRVFQPGLPDVALEAEHGLVCAWGDFLVRNASHSSLQSRRGALKSRPIDTARA